MFSIYELTIVLLLVAVCFVLFNKLGSAFVPYNRKWVVIIHSFDSGSNLHEIQTELSKNGIESRVELDTPRTNFAMRSIMVGDKGTIRKLLVQGKDLQKAREIMDKIN